MLLSELIKDLVDIMVEKGDFETKYVWLEYGEVRVVEEEEDR